MHRTLLAPAFASLLAATPMGAPAANLANLQSIPLTYTCAAQGGGYARPFVDAMSGSPPATQGSAGENADYLRKVQVMFATSTWARCVKKKQWISDALCAAILQESGKDAGIDMRPVFARHGREIEGLKQVVDYFETAFPRGGVEPAVVPTCPEQ